MTLPGTQAADSGRTPAVPIPPSPDGPERPSPVTLPPVTREPARLEQDRLDSAAAAMSRPPVRRVRHKLRRVDLWSVLKISLCFYTAAMAIVLLTGIALWLIADAAGIRAKVEKNIASLFSAPDYHIVPSLVLEGAALIALVLVALLVIVTVVGAALYNVFSDLFGGVEFTTIEEEIPVRRRPN